MGTERPESITSQAIALIERQLQEQPKSLIVIVGPTASGKTALALALRTQFPIEIISADSRLLYQGMDIGTAKPTSEEQQLCPHHLIDILKPNQSFSAADFQKQAFQVIQEVLQRGHVPVLVGGTMLYLDAVVYNYQWPKSEENESLKQKWRAKKLPELQALAFQLRPDIDQWVDTKNPVRLQRVLMHHESAGKWLWEEQKKGDTLFPSLMLGLNPDKIALQQRITQRVEQQWQQGLVTEVQKLLAQYPPETEAFSAIGYRQIIDFLQGNCSESEAKANIIQATQAYAKRQLTWWKRNQEIVWLAQGKNEK